MTRHPLALLGPALLLTGRVACAQSFELQDVLEPVADLEVTPAAEPTDSSPRLLASDGTLWLFEAETDATATALFLSDGSPTGTVPVDWPAFPSGEAEVLAAEPLPGGGFLAAVPGGAGGSGLLRIDPSGATTDLAGAGAQNPGELEPWNGEVWFLAEVGVSRQVWRSDGSASGTVAVTGLNGPAGLGDGARLRATGGGLFIASENPAGTLWVLPTPGVAPLQLVQAPVFGPLDPGAFELFLAQGSSLLFSFNDGIRGLEPWVSDGTVAGTRLLVDVSASGGSDPFPLDAFGDRAWFAARGDGTGHEPYFHAEGAGAAVFLGDLAPGPPSSLEPGERLAAATVNGLAFAAQTPATGREPWVSDGTPAGTFPLQQLGFGTLGSDPTSFLGVGPDVYFSAGPELFPDSNEVYRTDLTLTGTSPVAGIAPGLEGRAFVQGSLGPLLFAAAEEGLFGFEPYVLDVASEEWTLLDNVFGDPTLSSNPTGWFRVRDVAYFSATRAEFGRELFVTDGTPGGTRLLADLWPGPDGSFPEPLGQLGDELLFLADDGVHGRELWRTDGTLPGTVRVTDQFNPPGGSAVVFDGYVELAGVGVFRTRTVPSGPSELIATDGTESGTVSLLGPLPDVAQLPDISKPVFFDGEAWFSAGGPGGNVELWSTDGAPAGTQLSFDLIPGPEPSLPVLFGSSDQALFFLATDPLAGRELHALDQSGNVGLVVDLSPFLADTDFELAEAYAGGLVYSTRNLVGTSRLWWSDGAAFSNQSLDLDLLGWIPDPTVLEIAFAKGAVYVLLEGEPATAPGSPVIELWGAASLPSPIQRLASYPAGTDLELAPFGSAGRMLLTTRPPGGGIEHLRLADAEAGTAEFLAFADAGASIGLEAFGTRVEDRLLVTATDGLVGTEPFALSITGLGEFVAEPYGTGCGATIGTQGEPRLGQAFDITLTADPLAASGLFGSSTPSLVPLGGGCTAEIGPVTVGFATTTNAGGDAAVTLQVPVVPSLLGVATYWQWASLSPGGPFNNAAKLSGGLELLIGS